MNRSSGASCTSQVLLAFFLKLSLPSLASQTQQETVSFQSAIAQAVGCFRALLALWLPLAFQAASRRAPSSLGSGTQAGCANGTSPPPGRADRRLQQPCHACLEQGCPFPSASSTPALHGGEAGESWPAFTTAFRSGCEGEVAAGALAAAGR